MSAGFDWKPLLTEGEQVLWEGRPSRLKIFIFAAVLTAVSMTGWFWAINDVAQAPGGAECLSLDCPPADRKAPFVVYFAGPVSILLGAGMMIISPFVRMASAITSKRVLSITHIPLRKQPKFEQMPVKGAKAGLQGISVLRSVYAYRPHPSISYVNQSVVLCARSKAELKKAIAVIELLSAEDPSVPVRTP